MPKRFLHTEATLANITIHTHTNSSEAGHIAACPTVPVYCEVIYSKSSTRLRECLKVTFNSCARYIYGISRYEHISTCINRILTVPLDIYYSIRICCMINKIIKSVGSSRLFNLLVPAHSLNARACLFFVQGTILWNDLPPAVKRGGSMRKFRVACVSHLGQSASNSN
jgi:hypothetical protein